jgi:hypothetical protein
LSLGTSIETAELCTHRPARISATQVELVDDDGRVVVVPASQALVARDLTGVVRRALDTRLTFEVPSDRPFWILDAPAWDDCVETDDPRRRLLPTREQPYELTGYDDDTWPTVDLTLPLWLLGLERPDAWMLGPRAARPMVCIAQLARPAGCIHTNVFDQAARLLHDAVWRETTARAVAGQPWGAEAPWSFDDLAAWRPRFPSDAIFVWGFGEDVNTERITLYVHSAADPTPKYASGSLSKLRGDLIAELVSRGIPRAPERTAVCAAIDAWPPEHDAVATDTFDKVDMVAWNKHVRDGTPRKPTPPKNSIVSSCVDHTRGFAKDVPSTASRLLWITTAVLGHQMGELDPRRRDRVLALVDDATGDDPIARLAPGILLGLGVCDRAVAACDRGLQECGTHIDPAWLAYREWLTRVRTRASAIT